MEDSQKGASSTSDAKKKSSSTDDEIGKDFLTSWKLTTDGMDEMDFTSETPSRARKTKFDFGKLDDFEFGDDFGKMPSFKMDMSDLDFSSPQRKTEKSKERSGNDSVHEMKNVKQGVFSFNFDFNELEGFGLDSNLLKDEKKSDNDTNNKKFDCCEKNDINPDTKSNSANNISGIEKVPKDMGKSDEATSSKSGYMMPHRDVDVASHSTPPAFKNKCSAELFASDKHVTVAQENIIAGKKSEGHKEQLDISAYENLNTEKVPQVLSVQSTDMLALETPSVSQIGDDVMDLCDRKSDMEQVKSRDLLNSPDSRSSCSANALNLTYLSKDWNSNASDFGPHDQSDASKGSLSGKKTDQVMNVGNTAVPAVSSKPACQTKNEDRYSSSPNILLTSLRREPNSGAQQALQKVCFLKPLNGEVKQTGQALQKVCVSKPLSGEVTKQTEQACQKVISSKPSIAEAAKQRLAVLEDDRYKKSSPKQTTYRSPLNSMPKLGGLAHLRPPKINSVEKHGLCSVTNYARCEISRPSSKINLPISTNKKKSNLISICDMNTETNSRKSPKLASTGIAEKLAMLSPSLKRKSFEGSIANSTSLKSSKRSSESPAGKSNIVDTSPTINKQLVLNPENIEACSNDASPGPQTSSFDIPLVTSMMDVDVPLILEDDGNVQKAEACAKELEGICNMLKKKHEDAKELLVRAVVNNNLLLMLNHPIHEEKIRSLQKFASSLVSKDYEF